MYVKKGIELAKLIAKKLNCKIVIYKNFGTALVKNDKYDIEFISARTESYIIKIQESLM